MQSLTFLVVDVGFGWRPGWGCLQENPHVASRFGLNFLVTWWLDRVPRERDRQTDGQTDGQTEKERKNQAE